jgi:hypothetical protein
MVTAGEEGALYPNGMVYNLKAFCADLLRSMTGNQPSDAIL